MEKPKEPVYPASVKIPADFKAELDAWIWHNREKFSPLVIDLLKKHIDKNPLTAAERKKADVELKKRAERFKKG